MSLVVEDGTGKTDAEAYESVADFRAACAKLGYDLGTKTDGDCETALRQGFRYINTIGRYKAVKLVAAQRGQFPRQGLVDWSGNAVTGVPADVIDAQTELSFKGLTETLYEDLDRGGMITSETVGPISTSYAFNAPAGKTFRAAMQFLAQYLRDKNQAYAPYVGGAAGQPSTEADPTSLTPLFEVGFTANRQS